MTVTCEDTFIKNAVFVNIYDDSYENWDLLGIAANNFSKKFINLNWRWSPHRNLIAAFLAYLGSISESVLRNIRHVYMKAYSH
jgi:hypothetical protein